jgi:hypothetical protein
MNGSVYGGQQPIAQANIALYAAATSGYAGATKNLLNLTVTTNANGGFNLAGDYSCTAGQQLYIVATGGNPGSGTNANLALMAALGDCATLSSSTVIKINEATTVAAAFALAPFMHSIQAVGTTELNTSGLAHAFLSASKLVNISTGQAPGNALPAGAVAPVSEIYTLANILASCINSTGGAAGDNPATPCGTLFSYTTPAGGSAPTDTIQAALNIAHNPTSQVQSLYRAVATQAPFSPTLSSAPPDWTLAVSYTAASTLKAPKSTTVDAAGNIWIANSGNNSITVLSQGGVPLSFSPLTGNGLNAPSAIAIDIAGDAWIANTGGNSVSAFTSTGATYSSSAFTGANTINAPSAIAIDAPGNIWIANKGNSTLTELNSSGTYLQTVSQGISAPAGIAINPK